MNGLRLYWAALLAVSVGAYAQDNADDVKGGAQDDAKGGVVSSTDLVDATKIKDPTNLSTYLTKLQTVQTETGPAIRMDLQGIWAGFWQHKDVPANWSAYDAFKITMQNLGSKTVEFTFKVDGAPLNTDAGKVDAVTFALPANSKITYVIDLNAETAKAHGFRAMPPAIEGKHVRLFMTKKANSTTVYRWSIYQRDNVNTPMIVSDIELLQTTRTAIGIVDGLGQYSGGTWQGKAYDVADMQEMLGDEQIDLANNPGPNGLQGSMTQPALMGTAPRWRTAKTGSGKWYLVHPNGRRFWSFGVTCMNWKNDTSVTGREYMFQNLPGRDYAGQFYGSKNGKETFDFVSANLSKKYGNDYQLDFVQQGVARLKSWGMNTAGAWSVPMESQTQVPYTICRNTQGFPVRLNTPMAYWSTLPDVFDPTFQTWTTATLKKELTGHNGKQNFLGIFVDNEISWGLIDTPQQRYQIAIAALNAPMTQPSKKEIINQLKARYRLIGTLNKAWGRTYTSWTQLEAANGFSSQTMNANCEGDLRTFITNFAKAYYGKVRTALTAAGCTGLYLGAREAWPTPETAVAAMMYVDVYSMNIYRFADRIDWTFPQSNKPVMIGEFSFGSNDRGGFNPGTGCVIDQAARAAAMKDYTMKALQSPKVVGVHWFQYYDQPVSGRAQDGESYAIGLVSITDNPYSEMVQAARQIGQTMYQIRGL